MPTSLVVAARSRGLVILGSLLGLAACKDPQLKGTKAEVQEDQLKVTLPAVPSFEVPKVNADGSHTVRELRIAGTKYLGTEVVVHGVVTWVYDCATEIRKPGESDEMVAKRIEEAPEQCRRRAFYIGDDAGTPVERSSWVVEVPRNFTAAEKKNLPKEQIEHWPPVPEVAVGDEVLVTGSWSVSSPKGESNTGGLLVYKSMRNVTKNLDFAAAEPWTPEGAEPGGIRPPAH